jgi:hypothetical protein
MCMGVCRLFISQKALDEWVAEGRAELDGEELLDRVTGHRFRLSTAVRFVAEVTGGPDEHGLVGKVKDADQLLGLTAEVLGASVVLGDNAYDVEEGFVGTPIEPEPVESPADPRAATIASLQAFFLNNVK